MSKIVSSFSNTTGDLKSLDDEYVGLVRFFNKPEIKSRVDFEPHVNEDLDTLTSTLLGAKKEMRLFHFSGHSRQSGLDFPEGEFDSQHVIRFFNTLNEEENNLQCMFINGCENAGIIRKLDKVPVVIGTKSKIQDSVAQKFTQDFFRSLISGQSSYRQAFLDALAAQKLPDYKVFEALRGEGAAQHLRADEPLNQYYMVVNDEEVAKKKFPFRKGPANFAKYIFILLILLAVVLGILFRDHLIGMVRGYTCPTWEDNTKCRMLVADFNYSGNFPDINELIAEEITDNKEVNSYIEAKHTPEFKDFLKRENARQELHRLCGYEFSLTGDVVDTEGGKYKMELDLYTDYPDFSDADSETIEIGSTDELKQMVQTVGPQNSDHFLLNRLCIACAQKREELIPVIEKNMQEYRKTMTSAESYQNLNMEMFALHKKRGDSEKMLKVLSNIADVGNNDFVLGALERTVRLNQKLEMIPEAFENQTRYIEEAEMRLRNPSGYKMGYPENAYVQNQLKMRLNRGNLVLAHPDMLREHLRTALLDFRILQETKYRGGDYRKQIQRIMELLERGAVAPPGEMNDFAGYVRDQDGRPVTGVLVQVERMQVESGTDGRFLLEFPENEQISGKTIAFSKEGYQPLRFRIRDAEDLNDVRLERQVQAPEVRSYTMTGEVRDCDHDDTVLKEILINGDAVRLRRGTYRAQIEAVPGSTVRFSLPEGFMFRSGEFMDVDVNENGETQNTLTVYSEKKSYQVKGRVVILGDPIGGAKLKVLGGSGSGGTKGDGTFAFAGTVDICSELEIQARGYEPRRVRLKGYIRSGDVVDLGDISMKSAQSTPAEEEQVKMPEVLFQSVNLNEREYDKMLSAIKEAGYPVSGNSQNYREPPGNFPKQSTIQYLNDDQAKEAKKLAKLLDKATGQKFKVEKYLVNTRIDLTRSSRNSRNIILVRYFPNRRID